MREVAARRATMEAELLDAARDLAAQVGRELLADKGFSDVEELTVGQRRRWRAETKRLACAELQVALGVGVKEARQLVGTACAPAPVRAAVHHALRSGLASWGHVRGFWDRCANLPAESAALVAESLFGSDPAGVVPERLGPDGELLERPWHAAQFWAALEREAVRVEGQDVQAERERRTRARAERRVWLRVDDDSTATLAVTGPLTSLCAISQRLDSCAKSLRKAGDERTLAQLRSDVAQTLLLHGTLTLPHHDQSQTQDHTRARGECQIRGESRRQDGDRESGPGDDSALGSGAPDALLRHDEAHDPLVTPGGLEAIAQIITAQPDICLQVVIPWDTLTGRPACSTCRPAVPDTATARGHGPPGDDDPAGLRPGQGMVHQRSGDAVGEALGRHPAFITPGHARELALAPGTTLSRLLVDPADGRLIERSISSYRPDAAMRRQVIAADVYSRAPGSRTPATSCELDHETPWGTGGATSETNLTLKDVRSHQFKTARWWTSTLTPRRDLTWQTLLGQVERTRGHDYRQYLPTHRTPADESHHRTDDSHDQTNTDEARDHTNTDEARDHTNTDEARDQTRTGTPSPPPDDNRTPTRTGAPTRTGGSIPTFEDDLDLACRALYTALAHRGTAALLADTDDADGATDHDPRLTGWITLTHRGQDGQRRGGPPEDLDTLPTLLGFSPTPEHATETDEKGPRQPWDEQPDAPPPF
ncbi:HNH endonuclease signature motif containing protein [Serinicoccus marinus]|uniref:HNH endonuclease signature motif containing protein n=1 Tax=Serinicoccus marinus TaxID=247333 RepID=UPI00249360FF|nr:HNH endonuclease signature motif containing protein [Serinicoccus marinus]